jgi:hypothetical protein
MKEKLDDGQEDGEAVLSYVIGYEMARKIKSLRCGGV